MIKFNRGRKSATCDKFGSNVAQSSSMEDHFKTSEEENNMKNSLIVNESKDSKYIFHVKRNRNNISEGQPLKYTTRQGKEIDTWMPSYKGLPIKCNDGFVECPICFKKLKESSYKQHTKTHFPAKPFQCNLCSSRFTRRGDVLRHRITIHENANTFNCNMCNKTFFDRKSLVLHSKSHRKCSYSCQICGHTFIKKYYYDNHIKFVHSTSNKFDNIKQVQMSEINQNVNLNHPVKDEFIASESITFSDEVVLNPSTSAKTVINIKNEPNDNFEDELDDTTINIDLTSIKKEGMGDENTRNLDFNSSIMVSNGIANFTHSINPLDLESSNDNEIINDVIDMIVDNSKYVLEHLQSNVDNTKNVCKDALSKQTKKTSKRGRFTKFQSAGSNAVSNAIVNNASIKSSKDNPGFVINDNVGGSFRKFVLDSFPNPNSKDGKEMVINIVNTLTSDKGEIKGPVEVLMPHDT